MSQIYKNSSGGGGGGVSSVTAGQGIVVSPNTGDVVVSTAIRPIVSAYLNTGLSNVTGDGTVFTIPFDTIQTDTLSNYNTTTGIFTASVNGNYLVSTSILPTNIDASQTQIQINIIIGSVQYNYFLNPVPILIGGGFASFNNNAIAPMTVGQTASVNITVSGDTLTVGLEGENFGHWCSLSISKMD